MKKLQAILLATVLLVGTFASAAELPAKDKKGATTDEIRTLLTDPTFIVEEDTAAYVTFMLNKEGEIIVLTVDTEDAVVESFVKARLNYHKLSTPLELGKEYQVPILLKA
jgi:hypothetical protein